MTNSRSAAEVPVLAADAEVLVDGDLPALHG
jgi:hypothetical protein